MKVTLEPDIKVVEKESTDLVTKVNGLTITNQLEYEGAAEFLKQIKGQEKKVKESFDPIISKAYQTHNEAVAQKNKFFNPLAAAEKVVKNLMSAYQNKKEAEAKEEQCKLQEAADREAEKERKRIQGKIDRAEVSGKLGKAESLKEEKESVSYLAPMITPNVSKPEGVSYRDSWTAVVENEKLIPREYLMVNQKALDGVARATKGTLNIPGVKWNCEKILASRL